jgi:hypothetical protein
MRLFGLRRLTHCASLVAAALLLCLAPLLFWSATGAEVPGTLAKAAWSQMGQGANGEEAQDSGRGPVNAGLLTALLLAFCFGTMIGWLLAKDWEQEALRSSGITGRPSFVTTRKDRPFLSVFRL